MKQSVMKRFASETVTTSRFANEKTNENENFLSRIIITDFTINTHYECNWNFFSILVVQSTDLDPVAIVSNCNKRCKWIQMWIADAALLKVPDG